MTPSVAAISPSAMPARQHRPKRRSEDDLRFLRHRVDSTSWGRCPQRPSLIVCVPTTWVGRGHPRTPSIPLAEQVWIHANPGRSAGIPVSFVLPGFVCRGAGPSIRGLLATCCGDRGPGTGRLRGAVGARSRRGSVAGRAAFFWTSTSGRSRVPARAVPFRRRCPADGTPAFASLGVEPELQVEPSLLEYLHPVADAVVAPVLRRSQSDPRRCDEPRADREAVADFRVEAVAAAPEQVVLAHAAHGLATHSASAPLIESPPQVGDTSAERPSGVTASGCS